MGEIGRPQGDLDTPALWVDLDILEANIANLARHFREAGVAWRPHIKGIKVPAIAHKLLRAGAIGVTCAKLSEAEVMAAAGIRDLLIANQVVGEKKITRLAYLRRTADVKVAVDYPTNVDQLGAIAVEAGVEIGVLVDIDTGMHRTGTAPGETAVALARQVNATPGLRFLGLMGWEGHAVAPPEPAGKEELIQEAVGRLLDTAARCRAAGLTVSIISGGGSGTYKTTPFISGMTEIQAGGAIFSDVAYESWGVETTPCLFLRTLVTSRPAPNRVIIDAGFKALPIWHARPRALGLAPIEGHATSAEHGVLTLRDPAETPPVGAIIDFILGYTDSTLFLHDTLYGVRNGLVESAWTISARGKLT